MTTDAQTRRVHAIISGRVQGVFFRASVRDRARELGLVGSARNLPDGRVEVELQGPSPAVEQALAFAREGPPMAQVDDVTVTEREPRRDLTTFSVR